MKKNQQGFTLIELMIVIAIIAILMAYALPAYRDYTIRAKLGEGNAMAASVKMAVNESFVRNGTLTGLSSGKLGIPAANDSVGECVKAMDTNNGEINVTFGCTPADTIVDNASIKWTPAIVGAAKTGLKWSCKATGTTPGQDPC